GIKIASLFKILFLFIPDVIGDLLIFSKIRKILGGKLHVPISGGGKLPDYMDDFFNAAHINVLEGYGMTETSPVICVRTLGALVPRTVGRPIPGVEVMIGNDNFEPLENQHEKGRIYVRSKIVMQGYYKMPEVTAKVIKNGWLDTGDLGRFTLNGNLQIVGRAKETIVLTGGENIEPVPIEDKILESELIQSVMLVGQDRKYLAALVIPNEAALKEWAENVGLKTNDYEALCESEEVNNELLSEIRSKVNMKNGFKACEAIKYVVVISKPFEVGDELTNSLKMKRNHIADKYADKIEEAFMKG
ncbi:MAG: AMP-binding protein, partial [Spirochaetales bacterium]|nr:AMP-binding protein [Spirochaetales bacterium]